jgi:hypothetical protein
VYLVKLPQPKRHRFGVPTRHALVGKGFKTHEAALACGQRLKGAIALFAAERRLGLDAGNDKSTSSFSQAIKDAIAAQHGCQPREDVHGLDVYVEQPPVTRLAVEGYGSSSYVIEDYENRLRTFYDANISLTPKQQLALDLYNLAQFENTTKTRFLTLITVVEILAKRKPRSKEAKAYLKTLSAHVQNLALSSEEQTAIRNGIGNLKRQSISEACKDYVAQCASAEDAKFFMNCYDARSKLVHTGTTNRLEAEDPTALDTLVSRLLIHSLASEVPPLGDG